MVKQAVKKSGEVAVPLGHHISLRRCPGRLFFSRPSRVKTMSLSTIWYEANMATEEALGRGC